MNTTTAPLRTALRFNAIRYDDVGRVNYIGAVRVRDLMVDGFDAPPAPNEGLTEEMALALQTNGAVQRRTTPSHVQGILDYIAAQAEEGEPMAFNAIVLYATDADWDPYTHTVTVRDTETGERLSASIGEGLHRGVAWANLLGLAKARGVRLRDLSDAAKARIANTTIPVLLVVDPNLNRQKADFNKLNQQKKLTQTVMTATEDSALSTLTKQLVKDVALFQGRIDMNNDSPSSKSGYLLSLAQLRFAVATLLLGRKTRNAKGPSGYPAQIEQLVEERGMAEVQRELREVFTAIATRCGGLSRLHRGAMTPQTSKAEVVKLRENTMLASNAAWRALLQALHQTKSEQLSYEDALERLSSHPDFTWERSGRIWKDTLIVTGEDGKPKLQSARENIDAASDALLRLIRS